MTRLVSIVAVYPERTRLARDIQPAFEAEFQVPLRASTVSKIGSVHACVFELSVSDAFNLHNAERRLRTAVPGTGISMIVRFHDTWWRRYRWNVAITVGGGLAVIIIVELMRSSATRLYDLLR